MKRNPKRIFICNDDGIHGPGLRPLIQALQPLGEVVAVVPEQERSAMSHSITLHKPIRVRHMEKNIYMINGTPADTVRFGVMTLWKGKADAVVSGINRGANLGADTLYSGTLAAAKEGCMMGISSVALSLAHRGAGNFNTAARFAKHLVEMILRNPLPWHVCLNVNVPDAPLAKIKGVTVTRLGRSVYKKDMKSGVDPRGNPYYWLGGQASLGIAVPGSDMAALEKGRISVTPIRLDMTAAELIPFFQGWDWDVFGNGFKEHGRKRLKLD